jgi:DNA invertase Pin-like site-specific DNA recombinase
MKKTRTPQAAAGRPRSPRHTAAIYARAAADNPAAIERQVGAAYLYARAHGLEVGGVFVDKHASGLTFTRPGLELLLADVEARHVCAVIVADVARLGRDMVEVGYLVKRLQQSGVRVIADGEDL